MSTAKHFVVCKEFINEHIINDRHMKSIAMYYKIKLAHSNGRIYHYSPAKIASITGASAYLSAVLVKDIISLGLAEIVKQYDSKKKQEHDTLVLKSIQKLKHEYNEHHKAIVFINRNETLKEITFRLKALSIEDYIRRQKYVLGCKVDQNILKGTVWCDVPIKRIKKINKIVAQSGEELNEKTVLSSRKLCRVFGVNPSDFRSFKEFTFDNLCWAWEKGKTESIPCPYDEYLWAHRKQKTFGYSYWYKGFFVTEQPTTIQIPYL